MQVDLDLVIQNNENTSLQHVIVNQMPPQPSVKNQQVMLFVSILCGLIRFDIPQYQSYNSILPK